MIYNVTRAKISIVSLDTKRRIKKMRRVASRIDKVPEHGLFWAEDEPELQFDIKDIPF
jgi:hypothetical protein